MLTTIRIIFSLFFILSFHHGFCQPTWTLDPFGKEKKPEQYEEKTLGSEKTATKNFGPFRHFIQNNVTHYNYYFNANNKINLVIERAKLSQKDDYSKLLSFYPYSLENTSAQKVELDSVIYKATAGILLHDLRNDWIDNLYLLIGKAYYLRNDLDSAALTFQFINYNLFPRKKKDDDENKVIGANSEAKSGILSIADKEDRNFLQKALTKAPSRNASLLWLTRTLIDKKEFGDAAGMLNILHHDPAFPARLHDELNQITAYWFYEQGAYDSSAVYLERGLSSASDKQELGRWEFLLAQMFEMSGSFDKASDYYVKAAKHTTDPLLDINAHLNDAKMARNSGNAKELENNIARLQKMAKKDRYESYRDIIYYSIAQLNLQQPDTLSGIENYTKSIAKNTGSDYREKAYLQLANIAYKQKDYRHAFAYYDSLMPGVEKLNVDFDIKERHAALGKVVEKMMVIEREDSLQQIAAMPAAERDAFLRKLSARLTNSKEPKEEETSSGTGATNTKSQPADLFAPAKGDWYFYNQALKSKGLGEFKTKWGKRNNVDNWRRNAASSGTAKGNTYGDPLDAQGAPVKGQAAGGLVENSYDALLQNIPLTPLQLDSSNYRIAEAMLALGKIFQFQIQDHREAIQVFEKYLERFPERLLQGDVYLSLYYSYSKLGDVEKADYYKKLVTTRFTNTPAGIKLVHPEYLRPDLKNPEVTKRYEDIYNLFIEGKFAEALKARQVEDSIYGDTYWTPQLMYIEAIYHIRQREDSVAIGLLTRVSDAATDQSLKQKAERLIEVLGRRNEIESYLTNLQVTRMEEERILVPGETKVAPITSAIKPPSIKTIDPGVKPVITDTLKTLPTLISGQFRLQPDKAHYVIMILDKVDPVYVNEAKNAFDRYNRQTFYNKTITISKDNIDTERNLLLISTFENDAAAMQYYDKIRRAAPTEISFLPASKYSFLIITDDNLQILKGNKEIGNYRQLLNNHYGNKF